MSRHNHTYRLRGVRTLTRVVAMLCLLLSSCAVKASIKQLLALHTTEQSSSPHKQNGKQYVSQIWNSCQYEQVVDSVTIQKGGFEFSQNILAVFFFPAFLFFLLSFRWENKENNHPLYQDSKRIPKPIPLFLEYRKLIIPFYA
ncbi:hypothetical protein G5B30_12955 [Sphingobacterium sp. SGG-5]|uniref:hypothetical protein n=1 Tax=Sphingobacterium sp. SGG-5 TaxID=2710881 RepID=UPI0013EDF08F|nr:hypothetical protein [Sphingobacterium sp. SGG-5]NGM62821.1 hypothetical protein [Sphingobacterium sp. SGG-5]